MGEAQMKDWHVVGQKVVCINAAPVPNPGHPARVLRAIYEIAEVRVMYGEIGLGFREHPLPGGRTFKDGGRHWLWNAEDFRPVRPTSIECFKAILTSPEVQANAPVKHPSTVDG